MKKQKEMTVDQLMSQVMVCKTLANVSAVKITAETVLAGKPDDVRERVMKTIYFSQHLINQGWHEGGIKIERKLDFYECTMDFFATNDLQKILSDLDEACSINQYSNAGTKEAIKSLQSLWLKHRWHTQDLKEIDERKSVNRSASAIDHSIPAQF